MFPIIKNLPPADGSDRPVPKAFGIHPTLESTLLSSQIYCILVARRFSSIVDLHRKSFATFSLERKSDHPDTRRDKDNPIAPPFVRPTPLEHSAE